MRAVAVTSLAACSLLAALVTPAGATAGHVAPRTTWTVQRVPSPRGATASLLEGVSCTSSVQCTAVGIATTPREYPLLAASWNGRAWRAQAVPTPAGSLSNALNGVACTSASHCVAVGYRVYGAGYADTLVEVWNGTAWSIQGSPNHVGGDYDELARVACASATSCQAVGYYSTSRGATYALAEGWNGHRWSVEPVAQPAGAATASVMLAGVACPSASSCTAVGHEESRASVSLTLIERWNGARWAIARSPNPRGADSSELRAVACRSASSCVAVGDYSVRSGHFRALVERWSGAAWALQASPSRPGATEAYLDAVSCTGGACTAVGWVQTTPLNSFTLIEVLHGAGWTIAPSPTPAGSTASLADVACVTATTCTAVGSFAVRQSATPLALHR